MCSVAELLAAVAPLGVSEEDLARRFGPVEELARCVSPGEAFRMVVCSEEERRGKAGARLADPAEARRLIPRGGSGPTRAAESLPRNDSVASGNDSVAVAVDRLAGVSPAPSGPAPRGRSYRATTRRRVCDGSRSPSAWWLRSGSHSSDVEAWIRRGYLSPDPVEREITARLRRVVSDPSGAFSGQLWRAAFPVVSLAFVLWYSRSGTKRRGYCGAVVGRYRGVLALWSAHRVGGLPSHPDTVSRYLATLGPLLLGLLQWHQPSAREAARLGLPHSLHYCEGGRVQPQACNVYWWRNFEGESGPVPRLALGPDPASGYGNCTDSRSGGPAASPGKVPRAGPVADPPGLRPGSSALGGVPGG